LIIKQLVFEIYKLFLKQISFEIDKDLKRIQSNKNNGHYAQN
jgi:hypothetical protein